MDKTDEDYKLDRVVEDYINGAAETSLTKEEFLRKFYSALLAQAMKENFGGEIELKEIDGRKVIGFVMQEREKETV